MFYRLELIKELEIPPRYFASNLDDEINRRLRQDVEGTCSGKHGFVIAVTEAIHKGDGMIREGVGNAVFNVRYECIVFMPHKGEVMDAVVKSVNKVRKNKINQSRHFHRRRTNKFLSKKYKLNTSK